MKMKKTMYFMIITVLLITSLVFPTYASDTNNNKDEEIKASLDNLDIRVIDSVESDNITSDNINRLRDSSIQFEKSIDIDEIDYSNEQQNIVNIPLNEENSFKNRTNSAIMVANRNLIAYDIVPLSDEPYMAGNTYTFDFKYANLGDTIAYNVKTGIYINGVRKIVVTKDMKPKSIYTSRIKLRIINPGTVNLEMRVDEESGNPDIRKEKYVWVSKIGKGINYKSLTTPNDNPPYKVKEPIMLQSFIRNIGTKATGNFDFTMYRDGAYLTNFTIPSIEVGKYKIIQITYTENAEGNHTLKFVADKNNVVDSNTHERSISGYWKGNQSEYVWVTESKTITSHFGPRPLGYHAGVDIAPMTSGVEGDDVYAFADGTIQRVEKDAENGDGEGSGYGNVIYIQHEIMHEGKKVRSIYAHLRDNPKEKYTVGDVVNIGDVIGHMGNSGRSTGVHLHFEMREDPYGYTANCFDPLKAYFPQLDNKKSMSESIEQESDTVYGIYHEEKGTIYSAENIADMSKEEIKENNITKEEIQTLLRQLKENELKHEEKLLIPIIEEIEFMLKTVYK